MIDLEQLRSALRAGWGADTCDPDDLPDWRPDNPARGQCGVTSLIVHDLLGGELIVGDVVAGDAKIGHHYWNRLPDGRDVDLTAGQFHPGETVVGGRVQQRPPDAPRRCRPQYELLRRRVLAAIDLPPFEFAFPGPLRDKLVAAVLDGTKTTTTGLLQDYEIDGEPLPVVGTRAAVLDSAGRRVAVVEVTEARVVRLGDVDLDHARDEGEGDGSVAGWRAGHEDYWHGADYRGWLGDPAFTVDDDTPAVLERFRLVAVL